MVRFGQDEANVQMIVSSQANQAVAGQQYRSRMAQQQPMIGMPVCHNEVNRNAGGVIASIQSVELLRADMALNQHSQFRQSQPQASNQHVQMMQQQQNSIMADGIVLGIP